MVSTFAEFFCCIICLCVKLRNFVKLGLCCGGALNLVRSDRVCLMFNDVLSDSTPSYERLLRQASALSFYYVHVVNLRL